MRLVPSEPCNQIHRSILEQFKTAIVYGKSVKHQPQRVGLSHELADEDIGTFSSCVEDRTPILSFPGRHRRLRRHHHHPKTFACPRELLRKSRRGKEAYLKSSEVRLRKSKTMALTSPNYSQSQSSSADERGDELKLGGAWRPFVVMLLPTPPQDALLGPRRNKPSPAQTQTFSPPSGSSSSANPHFGEGNTKFKPLASFLRHPPPSTPPSLQVTCRDLTRVPIPWHRVQTKKKKRRKDATLPPFKSQH
ncbi:TGS domain-containing protein [Colletotrichum simmondsii]|uniref:TGS domain-containing protein n=1 Tax=Colletotrichum simmondsii TaxID=703756 RepID=A0A135S4K2_9PEZI|nr:TGS domain-containing protein [Colletotrichum simmondsii]